MSRNKFCRIKKYAGITLALIVMCCMSVLFASNAFAASASLWFTDPTVTVGNNVSVTVDIKGSDIGGYQMNVSYDSAYLTFVSSSGNTDYFSGVDKGGVIAVSDMRSSGSASKMSFTLTFKTKKTGSTKLKPSEYIFFDGNGDDIVPGAIGDSTIKINAVPVASSDANLKSLSVSGADVSPVFSPNVTEYTATCKFDVTSLTVSAIKNHKNATVYVSGNEDFKVGENTVEITVTAENGTKKVYVIKVTREKNPLSSDVFVTMGEGVSSEVALTISADIVPKGFMPTTLSLGGKTVDAVKYDEESAPAVYLLGGDNIESGFYFVDAENMTAKPFEYFLRPEDSLMIIDTTLADVPKGYVLGKFTFGDIERAALVPSGVDTPNHCLVYAMNESGVKILYMYDPEENTYQRYGFAEMGDSDTTDKDSANSSPDDTKASDEPAKDTDNNESNKGLFSNPVFKWCFIAIVVLIVAAIVVAIVLSVKYN